MQAHVFKPMGLSRLVIKKITIDESRKAVIYPLRAFVDQTIQAGDNTNMVMIMKANVLLVKKAVAR